MSHELPNQEEQHQTPWQLAASITLAALEKAVAYAAELEYMTTHDEMIPNVYNLRGIEDIYNDPEKRQKHIRQTETPGKPDSVIMFDLDEFKSINDNHTHEGGDLALKRVAEGVATEVKEHVREGDLLGRLHGDEFILVLLGTEEPEALVVANKLVKRIEKVGLSKQGVGETISMGVAEIPDFQLAEGIKRADETLYLAKERGRNQAACFSELQPVVSSEKVS